MWELDHNEGWVPKNWCFWTVVLEKTLGIPLDCMEIKSVNPEGNQPCIFTERTDAEAEIQYFDHLMWRTNSLKKALMPRKTEGRRRGWQGMRQLDGITYSVGMCLSSLWEKMVMDREAWHARVHGVAKSWTWLSDRTTTKHQLFNATCFSEEK